MAGGKILVIRGGAIGDFILTLPVLAALRQNFPESRLEVLGYAHIARLASMAKLADGIRSIESRSLAGFFARNGELSPELSAYFASFDIIVSYLFDPDKIFETNVGRCSKAQFIAGQHRPDEQQSIHATDVFLKVLERLAIFDADPVPRLNIPISLSSIIALHPGSGSEMKNWPEARWAELLDELQRNTDQKFLLIGGEAEGGKLDRLTKRVTRSRLLVAKNLHLDELAQHLARCSFFIGHDSGITHLAAAVGLPGMALWGQTRAEIWRPRSDKIRILKAADGLSDLSAVAVLAELLQLIRDLRTPETK